MQHRLYTNNKLGFTLLEVVLSMFLLSIIMAAFPVLLKMNFNNTVKNNNISYNQLHKLYSDIKFDTSIGSDINGSIPNTLKITRLDGCIINYTFLNNKIIKSKANVCASSVNHLIIDKIETFSYDTTTNTLTIKGINEKYNHNYILNVN